MKAGLSSKALNVLTNRGNVVIALTPDDDGSMDALSLKEFMRRHTTLILRLRMKLTRLHTLFSPNCGP